MDPTVISLVQLLARMERIQQDTENALLAAVTERDQLRIALAEATAEEPKKDG